MLGYTASLGIATWCVLSVAAILHADNFILNGSFEETKDSKPIAWSQAKVPAEGLEFRLEKNSDLKSYSAAIENTHRYEKPVANNWVQEIANFPKGRTVRIRAKVRTADAESANICLQCWKWNDRSNRPNMVAFASTSSVKGSHEWHEVFSNSIEIPEETDNVMVRAVLGGTGTAWFDDIRLEIDEEAEQRRTASQQSGVGGVLKADKELTELVQGSIVEQIELSQDSMVLAYLPDWSHGNVDNIAVANNGGGVQTLLKWPDDRVKDIGSNRVVVAMYARKVTALGKQSPIIIQPISNAWTELTSWKTKPEWDNEKLTFAFEAKVGWKLFDITDLVSKHPQVVQNGIAIHFEKEREMVNWSGYAFASREAIGEWLERRPRILVVRK